MIMETSEGKKSAFMTPRLVNWPLIHNIVVVTSPIGVQAPPAFAAITTMQQSKNRSALFGTSLRKSETIRIVVVKLSRMAERKKATNAMIHNIFRDDFV